MQNNVNSNISWYEGHTITSLGKILKFSKFYVQNIWQVVRWWHHQLTHLHIHIDWSRNVKLWKFAKLQSVITSLFFNRFSSGFHCYVWNFFTLSSKLKLILLWSSSLKRLMKVLEIHKYYYWAWIGESLVLLLWIHDFNHNIFLVSKSPFKLA